MTTPGRWADFCSPSSSASHENLSEQEAEQTPTHAAASTETNTAVQEGKAAHCPLPNVDWHVSLLSAKTAHEQSTQEPEYETCDEPTAESRNQYRWSASVLVIRCHARALGPGMG